MGGNGIEKKSFRSSPPHTVATRHRDVGSDIGYSSVDEALTELVAVSFVSDRHNVSSRYIRPNAMHSMVRRDEI